MTPFDILNAFDTLDTVDTLNTFDKFDYLDTVENSHDAIANELSMLSNPHTMDDEFPLNACGRENQNYWNLNATILLFLELNQFCQNEHRRSPNLIL